MNKEMYLKAYENMYKGRVIEDFLMDCFMEGNLGNLFHPGHGEEACGAGSVAALEEGDFLCLHHRNHTHCIARGLDMKKVIAETMNRDTGYNHGVAGDYQFASPEDHVYGLGGTLGPCFTIPNGIAHMQKVKKTGNIVVAYSGDNSTSEGAFHEGMNAAKALNLPVLMIIQNNKYGVCTRIEDITGIKELSTRGKGYEIQSRTVDGNDVETVYSATKEAAEYVRAGKGPYLLELMTWRQLGHGPGDGVGYKDPEENAAWLKRDPLILAKNKLKEKFGVTEEALAAIRKRSEEEMDEVGQFALNSPLASREQVFRHIYAEG